MGVGGVCMLANWGIEPSFPPIQNEDNCTHLPDLHQVSWGNVQKALNFVPGT